MKKLTTLLTLAFLLAAPAAWADVLFGKSTVGTYNLTYTVGNDLGSVWQCASTSTVYWLDVYCNATGNDLKLAVYSADGSTLLCETATRTATATATP